MSWVGQKTEDEKDRVQIFDFDTKTISTIPAAELAPGMICVTINGVEGDVWVDGARLQQHAFQQPPFSEEVRDQLRTIKAALDEVYPMTLEAWEEGFRRDRTPEREIAYWLHLTQVYSRMTAPDAGSTTIEKRRDIFRVLATCGVSPRDQVHSVLGELSLTREEVEAIIEAFHS